MARRLLPLRVLMCMLAFSLVLPQAASAQDGPTRWQALGAPAGRVTLLAAASDGVTIYAVSVAEVNRNPDETQTRERGVPTRADALYKSVDAGQRWQPVTNDLPPGEITALFVDNDGSVWVGLQRRDDPNRGELWTGADGGALWRAVELDRGDLRWRSIAQDNWGGMWALANATDRQGGNVLYYRQENYEWETRAVSASAPASGLLALPAQQRLFLTTDAGDLLISMSLGESWEARGASDVQPTGRAHVASLPDRTQLMLLVRRTANGLSIERSEESGDGWWSPPARGLPMGPVTPTGLVAAGRGVVLLATDRGVYRSADAGMTWQALEGALDSGFVYSVLPLASPSTDSPAILAGTAYGLFVSGDRGALWRQAGAGLPHNSAVLGLLTHPHRPEQIIALVRAVGATDASLMLVSRDRGATWLPAGPAGAWTNATAWAMDPRDPDRLYLAGANYVATSEDGGVSWRRQEMTSSIRRTTIAVSPSDPERVYVDGAPRLVSENGGETWTELPISSFGGSGEIARGAAVDPMDPDHVWFGLQDGIRESRDGGKTFERFGQDTSTARWLIAMPESAAGEALRLFAGVENAGIIRWDAATNDWRPAQKGLPSGSNIVAFAWDALLNDLLWATRDGGGIYASGDGGANWQNAGRGAGDNLGLALAPNYGAEGGWLVGTANAGIWLLGAERVSPPGTPTPPGSTSEPMDVVARSGVDARIEVVWPHGFAPLQEAALVNVGIRLFLPRSLEPPSCGWRPSVELWRAVGTEPATRVSAAEQRTVDGQPFPYWDANDVDVSAARASDSKIYFLVTVDGVDTATSVWAHGADARTYFPEQLVPSGIATGTINEVDARIQIVWPHDETGTGRDVKDAPLANIGVTLFKRGTRLSVPPGWQPPTGQLRLRGAWNSEVSREFGIAAAVSTRQSGAITYPVWEFNDVPVERARDGRNRLYLWAVVDGVRSYPTIWAHGVDSRTYFPVKDEPVLGCLP
jgi:hypothetical protein